MMPPQGPPQMMNYGGLIYANGGPTQNLLEALGASINGTPLEESSIKDIAYENYLKTQGLNDYEIMEIKGSGNLENTVNNFYRDSLTTAGAAAAPVVDPPQLEDEQITRHKL
jgi:hypothetical protein